MACYSPLAAYQMLSGGPLVFWPKPGYERELQVPCGRCVGCRLERSRQWAIRCMHEAQMHKKNCFITLTYSDENLPSDLSLNYRHFQLFMKRLRKRFSGTPIRFYVCGEYGEDFNNPHFHACIFGLDFDDKVVIKSSKGQDKLYRSAVLESLWTFGYSSVGAVTFESAAYAARYILKKVTGDRAEAHYKAVDVITGELIDRTPEFCHMSLKPGIGSTWLAKYFLDVFPHDYVVSRGTKAKPPRYYDSRLEKRDAAMFEDVKVKRELDGYARRSDNTPARLEAKAAVTAARVNLYRRVL